MAKHPNLKADEKRDKQLHHLMVVAVIRATMPGYRQNPETPMDFGVNKQARKSARKAVKAVMDVLRHSAPNGNFRPDFEPGERVELVRRVGYEPESTTPGVVKSIDVVITRAQYLRVKFDNGEERRINPDVMRRIR